MRLPRVRVAPQGDRAGRARPPAAPGRAHFLTVTSSSPASCRCSSRSRSASAPCGVGRGELERAAELAALDRDGERLLARRLAVLVGRARPSPCRSPGRCPATVTVRLERLKIAEPSLGAGAGGVRRSARAVGTAVAATRERGSPVGRRWRRRRRGRRVAVARGRRGCVAVAVAVAVGVAVAVDVASARGGRGGRGASRRGRVRWRSALPSPSRWPSAVAVGVGVAVRSRSRFPPSRLLLHCRHTAADRSGRGERGNRSGLGREHPGGARCLIPRLRRRPRRTSPSPSPPSRRSPAARTSRPATSPLFGGRRPSDAAVRRGRTGARPDA